MHPKLHQYEKYASMYSLHRVELSGGNFYGAGRNAAQPAFPFHPVGKDDKDFTRRDNMS